jgi:predicted membrane protein (TIGR00267 family)
MNIFNRLAKLKTQFYLVLGFSEGIINALTLAAGRILNPASPLSLSIAFRVAAFSAITGAFTYFLAHYQDLRNELVEAERQLNLAPHGQLASSRLGRAIFIETVMSSLIGGSSSFFGALLPLAVGVLMPGYIIIAVALLLLLLLGILLARDVHGNPFKWGVGLLISGVILTYVGMQLNIV